MHYSACLIIDNEKILLDKSLDLPTTKINEGETTENAAMRIAKQIGIDAEIENFFTLNFLGNNQIYIFLCKIKGKGDVSSEYSWYSHEEIAGKELPENLSAIIDRVKDIL